MVMAREGYVLAGRPSPNSVLLQQTYAEEALVLKAILAPKGHAPDNQKTQAGDDDADDDDGDDGDDGDDEAHSYSFIIQRQRRRREGALRARGGGGGKERSAPEEEVPESVGEPLQHLSNTSPTLLQHLSNTSPTLLQHLSNTLERFSNTSPTCWRGSPTPLQHV